MDNYEKDKQKTNIYIAMDINKKGRLLCLKLTCRN